MHTFSSGLVKDFAQRACMVSRVYLYWVTSNIFIHLAPFFTISMGKICSCMYIYQRFADAIGQPCMYEMMAGKNYCTISS